MSNPALHRQWIGIRSSTILGIVCHPGMSGHLQTGPKGRMNNQFATSSEQIDGNRARLMG